MMMMMMMMMMMKILRSTVDAAVGHMTVVFHSLNLYFPPSLAPLAQERVRRLCPSLVLLLFYSFVTRSVHRVLHNSF